MTTKIQVITHHKFIYNQSNLKCLIIKTIAIIALVLIKEYQTRK